MSKIEDLKCSSLGVGGLHFGVYCNQIETTRLIDQAIDGGINFIDTAPIYGQGNSETFVGNAVHWRREKVILSTKVGLAATITAEGIFGVKVVPMTRANIRESVHKSLKNLKTDRIDLLQLHAFDPNTPLEETFAAISELVSEGKVRHVGCSNYDESQFRIATQFRLQTCRPPLASVQMHYNIIERRAEESLLPFCREKKVGVICNRALARGLLTGKYVFGEEPPSESRAATSLRIRRTLTKENLALVNALLACAQTLGKTATELALAWLQSKKEISTVLIGVRNQSQLMECLRSMNWKLSLSEKAAVDDAIQSCGLMEFVKNRPETLFEQ